jgi:Ca2+-binding RTX toxin-like protein
LGNAGSTAVIGLGTPVTSTFDWGSGSDEDWYRVSLSAGHHYYLNQVLQYPGQGDTIGIYDAAGVLAATSPAYSYPHNAFLDFVPIADGDYFVAAIGNPGFGDYTLSIDEDVGETRGTAATTLQPGKSIVGHIEAKASFDDDLYRVELQAGVPVTFRLEDAGLGDRLKHAYLQLFDSHGRLIKTGTDEISIDPAGADPFHDPTFYVGIGGRAAADSGYYELAFLEGGEAAPLPHRSLDDNSYIAPAVIDVFLGGDGVPADDGDGAFTSRGWSSSERAAVKAAFAEFERVANVTFNLVPIIEQADFVMLKNDAEPDTGIDEETLGYWWIGGTVLDYGDNSYDLQGVGVFNSDTWAWTKDSLKPGGHGYITLVHELGHGLGLKHPHDSSNGIDKMLGVSDDDDLGDFDLNQGIYTTMSYNDGWVTQPGMKLSPSDNYGWQNGLMALDIAMLQQLYGAAKHHSKDTTYTLPGSDKAGTYFQTIWDTGGRDTIRYTGSKDAVISLMPASLDYSAGGGGTVSYVKGVHGGFTIASGVEIENIKSGSGDDWLQGSFGYNDIDGGAGRDTIDYSYTGRPIHVGLNDFGGSLDSSDESDFDILRNIENIVGGGAGDKLTGNSGGNWLTGNGGDDTLRGNAGADRFVFAAKLGAGNVDKIVDFKGSDVLALDDKIFRKIGGSVSSGEFYAKAGAHKGHDASDRLVYDKTGGDLYYDKDGKGGAAAVLFATLKHAPGLDHGDFLIV